MPKSLKTLREIIDAHPEWADLPIAVYRSDDQYDYVGAAGSVYRHKEPYENGEKIDVVVFSAN